MLGVYTPREYLHELNELIRSTEYRTEYKVEKALF